MNGHSLLSVAGWWVAWVYALSLSLPMLLGSIRNESREGFDQVFERWAREVVFSSTGVTVSEADRDGLATLTALATKPAPVAGNVRVRVEELTARNGTDFEVAERGAEIHFDKGATEGKLRFLTDWGPDVRVVGDKQWQPPRSFRLRLQSGKDAVSAGDLAMCTVTIDDGPKPVETDLTPVRFARKQIVVPRKDVVTTDIDVTADSTVAEKVPVSFDLYRDIDGNREPLGRFTRDIAKGERKTSFRLADVFSPTELEKMGIADDGLPGVDEAYEVDLMASPPLFPDGPRTCRLVSENTNPPPASRIVYFDEDKKPIDYIDPRGFVSVAYDGNPLRNRSTHFVSIDGKKLPQEVVIDAGSKQGSLVSLAGQGLEGRQGRRCGVGSSCGSGCGKGQGGCSGKALCGEPVPGDYMLIVVNNERLHDPGDGIVEELRKALADGTAKPYDNGAIILNPEDEDTLTPESGGPKPEKMFQPFDKEGHDLAGQLKRIEEVVARKREAAAKPDLRAVVVWPERDLSAGTGLREVDGEDLRPMSFLLPDADASYARNVARSLMPKGPRTGDLTVRAPGEQELQVHLTNVIAQGNATAGAPSADSAAGKAE